MQQQDQDRHYMQLALRQAALAPVVGEIPIAAVLVYKGEALASAHNYREISQDPTAHAEMIVIRKAAEQLGSWRLNETTLYVTLEPCSMCAGAIVQSRIGRLVFGAWDSKAGACGSIFDIPAESRLNHRVEVRGGVREQESQTLLRNFFRQLRYEAPSARCPVSTYGRGLYVLDDITPLEQSSSPVLTTDASSSETRLFAPRPAYRWTQRGKAFINYSLKSAPRASSASGPGPVQQVEVRVLRRAQGSANWVGLSGWVDGAHGTAELLGGELYLAQDLRIEARSETGDLTTLGPVKTLPAAVD